MVVCLSELYLFYILLLIPPFTYLTQMALFISPSHLTEIHLNQINFCEELSKDLLYNKIEAQATDLLGSSDQRRAGCFPLDYILAVTVSRPHGPLLPSSLSFLCRIGARRRIK